MKIYAETGRLILREILPEDAERMFALDSDPEVHRYLGNNPVTDIVQSRDTIEFVRQQYLDFGIGRWAVIEKATGNFTGWSGLKFMTEEVNGHINFHDIGYRFIKQYWGRGYATESAKAAMEYGFNQLKLKEIFGMADVDNVGSNHVLQKIGLSYENVFERHGIMHNWYSLGPPTPEGGARIERLTDPAYIVGC